MNEFEKGWLPPLREIRKPVPPPPAQMEKLAVNLDTELQATWWGQTRGGNWFYRAEIPARHLPGQVVQLRYDDLQPSGGGVVMPRQRSNTAVWCYPGNATRGILMAAQKQAGFRVLIEVDDNYLIDAPRVPGGARAWRMNLDRTEDDKASLEAHERLVGFCDGVIVTTETLAAAYRERHGNVHVCRNSIDLQDWSVPAKPDDGVFRVGYAASHSHWFDAVDVERALSWAAHQPGVEVVIYGLGREWSFPHTKIPWTKNLAGYRESLRLLDVGRCPLRSAPWADSKSDVKLLEYSMVGAATVVSRTAPYEEWHDTDMALTADSPKDFLRHVKWLVANRDGAREMAARAKQRILKERTIETEIPRWRAACGS